jgi:hypothetical protein
VLLVGPVKFQGQLGHDTAHGRYRVPFLPQLLGGLGEPDLEPVAFCGNLADAVRGECLGAHLRVVVLDEVLVEAVDDVAS